MRGYFKYFRIPFIITAVFSIVSVVAYISAKNGIDTERHNTSWDNTLCVIDSADKMTDEEEQLLTERIMEIQNDCQVDMVFITLYDSERGYLDKVHQFADAFAEDNHLGYDYPGGSSIVFVDNWSRGGDGKIHSWISTTGMIRERISDSDCDEILYILDDIPSDDADPYYEYMRIADALAKRADRLRPPFSLIVVFIAALVIAIIYIVFNWRSKLGDVTVTAGTYINGGRGEFKVSTDTFSHKTVTKHRIERSSGGGGGGGGGGGSHGGGGHSR